MPMPANSNTPAPLPFGRSVFSPDAEARIAPYSSAAAGGRRAARKGWRLEFAPRGRRYVEPLMGWTAGDDTLAQLELAFPTLDAALAYAERQGLRFTVEGAAQEACSAAADRRAIERAYADILAAHLTAAWLEMRYGIGAPSDQAGEGAIAWMAANMQPEQQTGS